MELGEKKFEWMFSLIPLKNNKKLDPSSKDRLRTGFTTGACSAAASRAALKLLCTKKTFPNIEITLPNRSKVLFILKKCFFEESQAICSVIKDAGDDPDCTDKAELIAKVRFIDGNQIIIKGGSGVATVTKAGLGLEVGKSAINPVPYSNIKAMIQEELLKQEKNPYKTGVEVVIEVPHGEDMSKHTINARLGLIGGISILGTSGIVKPFSTAAYKRSIIQAIDLAKEGKRKSLLFTTGGKSEQYAMQHNPSFDEEVFIQVGDFIGIAMRHAKRKNMSKIYIYGMIGKLSKMANGIVQTHTAGSQVDFNFLASIAKRLKAPKNMLEEIKESITARRVLEICEEYKLKHFSKKFTDLICERVATVMYNHVLNRNKKNLKEDLSKEDKKILRDAKFEIVVFMTDFKKGEIIGSNTNLIV